MHNKRTIHIGEVRVDCHLMAEKIQNDIDFINAKIIYIKGQRSPNIKILATYQAMLESRYSVLEWILCTPAITNTAPSLSTTKPCAMEATSVSGTIT